MPVLQITQHNTHFSSKYKSFPYVNKQFSTSFYPFFTKKWNNTHKTLQNECDIHEYKSKLENIYKPIKYMFTIVVQTKKGAVYYLTLELDDQF